MNINFLLKVILITVLFSLGNKVVFGQQVPIIAYSTNAKGQPLIEVNSTTDNYYILRVRDHVDSTFILTASMKMGEAGTTTITDPLEAYPVDHYEVLEYSVNAPGDIDNDGIDDITEFNNMPNQSPLNAAQEVTPENGNLALNDFSAFEEMGVQHEFAWLSFMDGKEFVKFIILEFQSAEPEIYFINTNTHELHFDFATFLGVDHLAPTVRKGQVVYHPNTLSANGTLGTYAFNYSNNESKPFETVRRTQQLLASNLPYLENNLSYYVTVNNEAAYESELSLYQNSRVPVVYESDVYAGIDYWGLNQKEGYGFFRLMSLGEVPGPKDIVLYESIPNSLPRVGGIITSVIQTPLSHVNLRAIQDNVPNAFIRDPLSIDSIADLLDHYIYLKINQSDYEIREATLQEVNDWYEMSRPTVGQTPPLNMDYNEIQSLDNITFDMYDGFGAKVTNVATMRTFGFAEGTIPEGYGVPFYFYQKFMEYNNLFEEAEELMQDQNFIDNRDVRDIRLEEFRLKIETSSMPGWMLDALGKMQHSFPSGTSIRCRSSTNNEDLPGFSGAGLYDSKTQHPDEGHIAKSIKQIYASLWNLRAFEEREFYRINHFYTSMGVLCHPNYSGEKVNGVGVSADPVYNTDDTYYLNSQKDAALITNPDGTTIPEELLLDKYYGEEYLEYSVIQYSSLTNGDTLLMELAQMDLLRLYLTTIHDRFKVLYHAEDNPTFAMDIEYKINSENQLIIKQARPWVAYEEYPSTGATPLDHCEFTLFPNPAEGYINFTCEDCGASKIRVTDLKGRLVFDKGINQSGSNNTHISIDELPAGVYFVSTYIENEACGTRKFIKR